MQVQRGQGYYQPKYRLKKDENMINHEEGKDTINPKSSPKMVKTQSTSFHINIKTAFCLKVSYQSVEGLKEDAARLW